MTMNGNQEPDAIFAARIESLLSGLAELRSQIGAASRSEIAMPQLVQSAEAFWRDHGPVVRQATITVLESLRVQALDQAYGWRDQLSRSLDAQARSEDGSTRRRERDGAPDGY
jgi:hypothetical protein